MGCFSWLTGDEHRQIHIGHQEVPVRLLIPEKFGGGALSEHWYEGYGDFCGEDVYELVAEWNREDVAKILLTEDGARVEKMLHAGNERFVQLVKAYAEEGEAAAQALADKTYSGSSLNCWKRDIGISIACEDEDNAKLRYPIKFTFNPELTYELAEPALGDPAQGF